MQGIVKAYPGVVANDKTGFEVAEGEIHALLGENGAGKTTLMNILYGMSRPDSGQILWRGRQVHLPNPKAAMDLGIGMVHQHFMLVPTLNVVENITLGMPSPRRPLLALSEAASEIKRLSITFGLEVDPWAEVEGLPLGVRQRVEIVKALYRGAHLLILDEPTAVLTPGETADLTAILRRLVEQGHSVVFISHKLDEVMDVSQRVTVLRDGRTMATLSTPDTTKEYLAELMVGRPIVFRIEKPPHAAGDVVLGIEDLHVNGGTERDRVRGVSLELRRGEIVGIAGIDGNGQRALTEALCGLRSAQSGRVVLLGHNIAGWSPRRILDLNVGRIPEDRQSMGLVMGLSVRENLSLTSYSRRPFSRFGFLNHRRMEAFASGLVRDYDIRTPTLGLQVRSLSGGNQQKVVLAREMSFNPVVIIAANPSRGLDVGATEYVYRRLLESRERGTAVLLVSSDLEEVLALSDRIAVMVRGTLVGVIPAGQADRQTLGLMMAGERVGTNLL